VLLNKEADRTLIHSSLWSYLQKMFGQVWEHRIDGKVMKTAMFWSLVVVVVDEVLYVVVGADILNVLQVKRTGKLV